MTPSLKSGGVLAAAAAGLGILAGAAALADRTPVPALINESPSLPRGLYLRRPGAEPVRGAVVAVPQPPEARPYLAALRMPPDVVLIKRVAAAGGDRVCRRGGRLLAPGRTVAVHDRDRRGISLPGWRGCRRLGTEELFLLGDTPSSFDSRYFGPVDRARVTGVYREVLTW